MVETATKVAVREVYLDYNATTPVDPEVREAMLPFLSDEFGNPSSVHPPGRRARKAVENAREQVAALLNASDPSEIVFTSGATEANNMAILGATIFAGHKSGHIITTQIEHPCVLGVCKFLEEQGFRVTYLPVDRQCRVDPQSVLDALTDDTLVVSVMLANNETGTLQPVAEIARLVKSKRPNVLVHTDAVQAIAKTPVDVQSLGVDLLALSAHKFYGPKGIGALYIRKGVKIAPLLRGGHQEHGMRAGTENVAGIVGLGKAAEIARRDFEIVTQHLWRLRRRFLRLLDELSMTRLNGHREHTLPSTANVCLLGADALAVQANLGQRGVCVSVGSACSSGSLKPSHVLRAMGLSELAAFCSVRFSWGKFNTEEEIDFAVEQTKEVVSLLREITLPEEIGVCDENCPCFFEGAGIA
ncbi:cysteine desulfurase family protein [Fervidibacter sacchari]|jgi:Cysteine sulfinate desulfinase/cysteine desulfurase and related enzymes|uniref:cysteine desulfurase n=1 Tax=Candidatus Fervidibacter sacchari TaxID=1448929 RepID=A0ABT2EKI0_9BACT|nr:cysteine desulfurase family protein [Candidatus Fervidibacter sacchari]MCS3918454.1 cysteine desulfurase [Candidatus Fervidibacter sacchari]WKU16234.1 cysteine desulfurase family protein [Candidatus Fervidibacter sacchari]